ncbi:glucose dehydrogenase [FAD, quinone]-like [Rhopalosiphum padi]|uniref:glucose dehydrogenase [FAD, quinone]-like n=1 Tax=Rhopalosiphum padi TaxID=40932 RepID=UPI00298DD19E|nr:glucose dehydrogenase [FAD, quinone]-like [Rhopalosiphum padi]
MFFKIIFILLSIIFLRLDAIKYPKDFGPDLLSGECNIKFDFIVVGAGSAGSIIASRLSEISEWNVLLLEAGGDPPESSEIPLKWSLALNTEYDWKFLTEQEDNLFKGLDGERCHVPRGCMLGGSSSMNVMLQIRGTKFDFDEWEKMGCTDWGFDSILPYFIKSENFTDASRFDPKIHGNSGPLTVSPFEAPDPAIQTISQAAELMGLKNVKDLNTIERSVGYAMSDSTTRNGLRCSTLKAFLIPNSERPNLFVAKYTRVTKILIENKAAVGVEFVTKTGEFKTVNCTQEVIVSAGVIMSPQLLMISGIGPADHLKEMSVDVVADLPVGLNYQDHVAFFGLVLSDRKDRPIADIVAESQKLRKDTFDLIPKGISTMGLTGLLSFVDTKRASGNPDIEIMKIRYSYNTTRQMNTFKNMFGFSDEMANIYNELNTKSDIILMIPISNIITKTGRVSLRSNDPMATPKIIANYLSDQEEIDTMVRGIEFVVEMCKTKPMTDAGYAFEEIVYPNCEANCEWGTKDYWKCAIKNLATSIFHSVGTNKMGAISDKTSVVDPSFKVIGVDRLRVIDCSAMPSLVSCNTNAATMMMAEKGADMIKTQYGK